MPDLKNSKPNEDDDDVKKIIIDHDYKKLLARNCCWAGIHTVCIGLLLFAFFHYPICPYDQATSQGFIYIAVVSFVTFWAYILIILCDTLIFAEGITVYPEVFIHKLNQANSVWFMVNATFWCLTLVGLIVITAMAAPLFQDINDDDEDIFKVIECDAFTKCCDYSMYIAGHVCIIVLWAMVVALVVLMFVFYVVPACKRCCNKKKLPEDDDDDIVSDKTYYEPRPKPSTKTKTEGGTGSEKPETKGGEDSGEPEGGEGSEEPEGGEGSEEPEGGEGSEEPETKGGEGSEEPETKGGEGSEEPETKGGEGSEEPETKGGEGSEEPETKGGSEKKTPGDEGTESEKK